MDAAVPLPESAPEIVSTETLDALVALIDEVRKAPRSQVVRLGGMRPSPGAERIGEATGRVCVAVGEEAVLVAPASNCGRCNGSTAFRFRAMRKGESVTHPCECVSRQIRKVAPAPKFPTMAEKAASGDGGAVATDAPPAPVSTLADERRAHLTRRLVASKRVLDEAVSRMADTLGPHEANVAERVAKVEEATRGIADVERRQHFNGVGLQAIERAMDDTVEHIAQLQRRLAGLREARQERIDKALEYDAEGAVAKASADREAAELARAAAERDKVARRRQKDADKAAEEVARLERKIAECGATGGEA